MKSPLTVLKKGSLLIFAAMFLYSCASKPDKPNPKVYTVEIKQMQFQPADLRVQKGDTVIFVNKDILVHDVTEEINKSWRSSPLSPDQSYRMVVNESADYYCSIHPIMKGSIYVQ